MWRRLLLLDLLLLTILVAGGLKLRRSWVDFEAEHRVESVQPEPEAPRTIPAAGAVVAAVGDWTDIVTKNPFSFDRNDIAIVAPPPPPPQQEAPRAGPKPFLFGTFGIGQDWTATLASGQSGNRKTRPMKIGETIDGWQLLEIHDKSVVVVSGAVRETILIDTAIQAPRESTRTLASSAQPQPVVIQTSQPSAATNSAAGSASPAVSANNPAGCVPLENPSGKGHYIDTPFGKKCIEDK